MIATDRSRYMRGKRHCDRARFLEYSYKGVGLRLKAQNLPLATGGSVHEPLRKILEHARDNGGELASRLQVRAWIQAEIEKLRKSTEARGFDLVASEDVAFVVGEQACLIEGLVWVAYREFFPWLLQEFEIIAVEKEETTVSGCDCGLGDEFGEVKILVGPDGEYLTHEGRECGGVVVMSRPDFLARRKSDGQVGVWDFKTGAYAPDAKGYEHKVQFALGTLGAERRLGEQVNHFYVANFSKGKRDYQTKDEKENGGLKKQQSLLCYAWLRPADPPFDHEEWRFSYTKEKGFGRVPIWLAQLPKPAEMTNSEFWAMEMLPGTEAEGLVAVVGPFDRPTNLMPDFLEEIAAEEKEWAWKVSQVEGLEDPRINQLFRRSWDCDSFYGRECEFKDICLKKPGWEKPEMGGKFVARVPHHALEAQGFDKDKTKSLGFQLAETDEEGGWGGGDE